MTVIQDRQLDSLVLDLLEWLAKQPRTYTQTMEIWRTSCPRLAVWEEAVDRGLIARAANPAGGVWVKVTARGQDFLRRQGRIIPPGIADATVSTKNGARK